MIMEIINNILAVIKTLGTDVIKALISLCIKIVDFMTVKQNKKIQDEHDKKISDAHTKIDTVCDSGSLDDLFDMTRKMGDATK